MSSEHRPSSSRSQRSPVYLSTGNAGLQFDTDVCSNRANLIDERSLAILDDEGTVEIMAQTTDYEASMHAISGKGFLCRVWGASCNDNQPTGCCDVQHTHQTQAARGLSLSQPLECRCSSAERHRERLQSQTSDQAALYGVHKEALQALQSEAWGKAATRASRGPSPSTGGAQTSTSSGHLGTPDPEEAVLEDSCCLESSGTVAIIKHGSGDSGSGAWQRSLLVHKPQFHQCAAFSGRSLEVERARMAQHVPPLLRPKTRRLFQELQVMGSFHRQPSTRRSTTRGASPQRAATPGGRTTPLTLRGSR